MSEPDLRCMACGQFVSYGHEHECRVGYEVKHIEAWAKVKRLVKEFAVLGEDIPEGASDDEVDEFFSDPLIQSRLYAIAVEKSEDEEDSSDLELRELRVGTREYKAMIKHRVVQIVEEMNLKGFSVNHTSKVIAERLSDELGRRVSSKTIFMYLNELEEEEDDV